MSRKRLYLVVGSLWALLLGLGSGLAAAAAAAAIAWLFLFGDSSWPTWTGWAIPAFGILVGFATFASAVFVARVVANRHGAKNAGPADGRGGGAFAWGLLVVGLVIAVGFAWQQYGRSKQIERARAAIDTAALYFPMLLSETHRIVDIAVEWPDGDTDGQATVTLDGLRTGQYRLDWHVHDKVYERSLLTGGEPLSLSPGRSMMSVTMPVQSVIEGYRALLNRHDANVLVDEWFVFEAQLMPILTTYETSQLPPHELHNLANGWSALIRRSSAEFPVRFFLYGQVGSWD
ncbi:MAG: hypothetical protein JSU82_04250 [Rhodospirillales bacterium]|nr:MAG: hypothetical protein JSU82_04250 [Rhodospirillales bacterium]